MNGEITLGVKDILALVIGLGGPIAVYVGMREQITTLTAEVRALRETMTELRTAKGEHGESLSGVRETLADHDARLRAVEKHADRPITGAFHTLGADASGGHKPHP